MEDRPRVLRVSATDHSLFVTDPDRHRSWVVEADEGKTNPEVLASALQLTWSDPEHLGFADPRDECLFHALVGPDETPQATVAAERDVPCVLRSPRPGSR